MSEIRDSYQIFFDKFKISHEEFLEFVLENIISIPKEIALSNWSKLKNDIQKGNHTVYVRKYGRDSKSQDLYLDFYKNIFPLANIQIDTIGNGQPQKMLRELITTFSKNNTKNKVQLINYQVSHIWGNTKNPYQFLAPWNIVYLPKIVDPFSGHETCGILSIKVKEHLRQFMYREYSDLINEYNHIINTIKPKIDDYLSQLKPKEKIENNFINSVNEEFSEIIIK